MIERRERFRRLYDANYERILGYALRRTSNGEDAHDVVSETFLTTWRRLDDVPDGEEARLWLYGTARRVLANHHRSRRRQNRLVDQLEHELTVEAASVTASQQGSDWAEISAAFARLSGDDRELILLSGWEGLDAGQIAAVLGCTRATTRVRLHRARKRLAKQLAAEELQRSSVNGHGLGRWAAARPGSEEAL